MSFQSVRNHILSKSRSGSNGNVQIGGFGGVTSSSSIRVTDAQQDDSETEENFAGKYSHLTSTCKSDLFMLQMRRDKLNRVVSKHSGVGVKKEFTNNVTLGETEIQKVLMSNKDVRKILTRRKFRDEREAIISLSVASDLDAIVNEKLFELQQLCAAGLRGAAGTSGSKFNLTKPTGSKRKQVGLLRLKGQMQ